MSRSFAEQIHALLEASRREADRVHSESDTATQVLQERAAGVEQHLAAAQLARVRQLQTELDGQRGRIDAATIRLVESMAAVSTRLAEAARDADFSLPPWPAGIGRTVEIKLSETREVTVRFERGNAGTQAGAPRIADGMGSR